MKTILAAVDFSDVTPRVIAEAAQLARALEARLIVLHIVHPPVVTDSDIGSQMSAEYSAMASEAAGRRLAAIGRQLKGGGVTAKTSHVVGFPSEKIVEHARKAGADYIVLGSHGHGAFYEVLVGSTASRVLKRATCPVVIVPAVAAARPLARRRR